MVAKKNRLVTKRTKKNAKKIKRDINPMRIGNSTDVSRVDVKYENLNSFQTYRIALQKIICDKLSTIQKW